VECSVCGAGYIIRVRRSSSSRERERKRDIEVVKGVESDKGGVI